MKITFTSSVSLEEDWDSIGINSTCCFISSIFIEKEFRKRGLGELLLDRVLRMYGTYLSLVILCPDPLQFNGNFKEHDFSDLPSDEETALKKLNDMYESWGFTSLINSGLKYLDSYKWLKENTLPLCDTFDYDEEKSCLDKLTKRKLKMS